MQLGYVIAYVPDVPNTLKFFKDAFGLPTRFLHDSGSYAELETGSTTLAFATHELGDTNLPDGHVRASESTRPLGMEIALITPDVANAHAQALAAGAQELAAPQTKPWGQIVSYVRTPDGLLVELCSPLQP